MAVAFTAFCCGNILVPRKACGAHPCCAKGVCSMTSMGLGLRLDRCPDDAQKAPDPPITLTVMASPVIAAIVTTAYSAPTSRARDGLPAGIDRPPRV